MNNVYIGYDSREVEAYNTCVNSINVNTSTGIKIIPIIRKNLKAKGIYTRQVDTMSSTEFSFTRFLVPYLSDYKGWSIFCDCDFVFLEDIKHLFNLVEDKYAVMCCQHDYTPKNNIKMDGQVQLAYPRKNWSSLMLWNCSHPKNKSLTPEIVSTQTGQYLHRFNWLDDSEIGSLPIEWNWLVGWYKEPQDGSPKALHFTEGGPWFKNYENCEYSDVYYRYKLL